MVTSPLQYVQWVDAVADVEWQEDVKAEVHLCHSIGWIIDETDEKFKNTLTFKDLGIEKQDIIAIFIAEGILPKNFFNKKIYFACFLKKLLQPLLCR